MIFLWGNGGPGVFTVTMGLAYCPHRCPTAMCEWLEACGGGGGGGGVWGGGNGKITDIIVQN